MLNQEFIDRLFDVKGKVALITGATGALGKALCKGFGLAGMKVMITGRSEERCKKLMEELQTEGIECSFSAGDPAVEEDAVRGGEGYGGCFWKNQCAGDGGRL